MEDKRIKLNEQELSYRRNLKWHTLPYTEITQAYLRIEEVKGKLCCSVANFDMYFLMLKTKSALFLAFNVCAAGATRMESS